MPLIKSANAPTTVAPFSMQDIEAAARRILLRAQKQAEQLLAGAQAEAEQLRQAAQVQGLAEGRTEGLAKGLEEGRKAGHQQALNEHREKLTALVGALSSAAGELDSARRDLEIQALREVIELAIAIARRVTKRQAELDPRVLAENVSEAMKLAVRAADVRIAIHPRQRQTLELELPRLKMQWPNLKHVTLVEDEALAPGGCRIDTRHGQVRADIDEQLGRVISDLMPEEESRPSAVGSGQ